MSVKKRKKIFFPILFAGIAFALFFVYDSRAQTCTQPLKYKIGKIDSNFDISRSELISVLYKAEQIWENSFDKELFVYDDEASLIVNLIFDERQQRTLDARNSRDSIAQSGDTYEELIEKYDDVVAAYREELKEYESVVEKYENRLDEFNSEVATLEMGDPIAPATHAELVKKQNDLDEEFDSLDDVRIELNLMADDINDLSAEITKRGQELNENVTRYNERFGIANEFDQGEFNGSEINIYQYDNRSSLLLVLAHEFGHSLGISHVQEPKALMYPLLKDQDFFNPSLVKDDINAFRAICNL